MPQFQNYTKATEVTSSYTQLVDALIARRKHLGLSQEQLAMDIGCTLSLIHK